MVKTVGIALIITSGVPVGREGPAIHIGAGVAFIVSGVITRLQNRFKGNEDDKVDSVDVKRKMILYGSAAGFASAFRSPIGGVLYVIEEICTDWDVEGHKSTGGQLVLCAALAAYVTSVIIRATSEGGSDIDFSSIVITQEGQSVNHYNNNNNHRNHYHYHYKPSHFQVKQLDRGRFILIMTSLASS